jgi:hypothetical protein
LRIRSGPIRSGPAQIRTLVDIVVFAHNVNRSVGLPIQTLAIPDPDPALFVSGLKDANKKSVFWLITLLFVGTFLHHKRSPRSHKTEETKIFLTFLLDVGRIRI